MCTIINCLCDQPPERNQKYWRPQFLDYFPKNHYHLPMELWCKINDYLKQDFKIRIKSTEQMFRQKNKFHRCCSFFKPCLFYDETVNNRRTFIFKKHILINTIPHIQYPNITWDVGYLDKDLEYLAVEHRWNLSSRQVYVVEIDEDKSEKIYYD